MHKFDTVRRYRWSVC